MPMINFPKCWRGRTDCEPFQAIDGNPPDHVTEEQFFELEYEPTSFVCCGCVAEDARPIPRDAYRLCWKNGAVDEMGAYDEQDLAHTVAVISHALGVIATRRTNSGHIRVPSGGGQEMISVQTEPVRR